MNLLVTGGLGFIGSNFVNYIVDKYKNIIILDINDYCSSMQNIQSSKVEIVIGNINNKELVAHLLRKYHIDTIVHFAAQSHVDNSFFNSVTFTEHNVLGTHILLETSKIYQEETNQLKLFLHISTDEVAGENTTNIKFTESQIMKPTNPYACSKANAELLVQSYIESYKLPCIITRGNNCFGENQYPEKIIPKFICQLLNGEKITIQGDGSAKRNFIHVYDTCTAIETILLKGKIGEIYNIASECEYSVMEIAKLLVNIMYNDKVDHYISYIEDRTFNDCRYYMSSEKLEALGWTRVKNFNTEIKLLIEWYKINKSRYGF